MRARTTLTHARAIRNTPAYERKHSLTTHSLTQHSNARALARRTCTRMHTHTDTQIIARDHAWFARQAADRLRGTKSCDDARRRFFKRPKCKRQVRIKTLQEGVLRIHEFAAQTPGIHRHADFQSNRLRVGEKTTTVARTPSVAHQTDAPRSRA